MTLQKKYNAKKITMLYPITDQTTSVTGAQFDSGDGVIVRVQFIDLFDIKNSLLELFHYLN